VRPSFTADLDCRCTFNVEDCALFIGILDTSYVVAG
jgi:hypothetical protein